MADAPFIPSSPETGLPPASAFWRVFGTRSFFKLWVAQVVSSLGDWIGLAGLVISVLGFSVAIRQLIRIANASEAGSAAR